MTRWWIALGSLAAFIVLAVCVHLGLLHTFDATVRQWMRPDGAWGTTQERADLVVHALRPELVAGLLVALSAGYCVKRRSLSPAKFRRRCWAADGRVDPRYEGGDGSPRPSRISGA